MKVLLIQSYLGGNEANVFPLGLACIKAVLQNHSVKAIDLNLHEHPFKLLEQELNSFNPDVVGISLRNIDSTNKRNVVFYYPYLKEATKTVKHNSNAKVIVGGSGFSMFANEIMKDDENIDCGFYLEGETSFPKLIENLDDPSSVPSVFYRDKGEIKFTRPDEPSQMDDLPLPDRSILASEPYESFGDALGVETKRGCALNCIYCIYGFLNGKNYRLRSPEKVVDDIEDLIKRTSKRRFTFIDSIFNAPIDHAKAICEEIIRRKIDCTWSAWFTEKYMDDDFIKLIQNAGCDHAIFSPDGFTDSTLQKLGKSITNKDIIESHKRLSKTKNLEVGYNFFINPPGQSLLATIRLFAFCFFAKLKMKSRVHFEFSILRIEPHTKLFDIAVKEGIIKESDDLLYPVNYTQKKTAYIERAYNFLMSLRGR